MSATFPHPLASEGHIGSPTRAIPDGSLRGSGHPNSLKRQREHDMDYADTSSDSTISGDGLEFQRDSKRKFGKRSTHSSPPVSSTLKLRSNARRIRRDRSTSPLLPAPVPLSPQTVTFSDGASEASEDILSDTPTLPINDPELYTSASPIASPELASSSPNLTVPRHIPRAPSSSLASQNSENNSGSGSGSNSSEAESIGSGLSLPVTLTPSTSSLSNVSDNIPDSSDPSDPSNPSDPSDSDSSDSGSEEDVPASYNDFKCENDGVNCVDISDQQLYATGPAKMVQCFDGTKPVLAVLLSPQLACRMLECTRLSREYRILKSKADEELQALKSRRTDALSRHEEFIERMQKFMKDPAQLAMMPAAELLRMSEVGAEAGNTIKACDARKEMIEKEVNAAWGKSNLLMRGVEYLNERVFMDCGIVPRYADDGDTAGNNDSGDSDDHGDGDDEYSGDDSQQSSTDEEDDTDNEVSGVGAAVKATEDGRGKGSSVKKYGRSQAHPRDAVCSPVDVSLPGQPTAAVLGATNGAPQQPSEQVDPAIQQVDIVARAPTAVMINRNVSSIPARNPVVSGNLRDRLTLQMISTKRTLDKAQHKHDLHRTQYDILFRDWVSQQQQLRSPQDLSQELMDYETVFARKFLIRGQLYVKSVEQAEQAYREAVAEALANDVPEIPDPRGCGRAVMSLERNPAMKFRETPQGEKVRMWIDSINPQDVPTEAQWPFLEPSRVGNVPIETEHQIPAHANDIFPLNLDLLRQLSRRRRLNASLSDISSVSSISDDAPRVDPNDPQRIDPNDAPPINQMIRPSESIPCNDFGEPIDPAHTSFYPPNVLNRKRKYDFEDDEEDNDVKRFKTIGVHESNSVVALTSSSPYYYRDKIDEWSRKVRKGYH